jgi:hypothetical protein
VKFQPAVLFATCLALTGNVISACAQDSGSAKNEPPSGQIVDPLLAAADGGNQCTSCIASSCGPQLSALESELQTLRAEEKAMLDCVRSSRCLSLYWTQRDSGAVVARAPVKACIAGCITDSGLPAPDTALGTVGSLGTQLDRCVDTACTSQCPGAGSDHDDQDGAAPALDGQVPRREGGFPHLDAS